MFILNIAIIIMQGDRKNIYLTTMKNRYVPTLIPEKIEFKVEWIEIKIILVKSKIHQENMNYKPQGTQQPNFDICWTKTNRNSRSNWNSYIGFYTCKIIYIPFKIQLTKFDPLLGLEEYFNKFFKVEVMQTIFSGKNAIMLFQIIMIT